MWQDAGFSWGFFAHKWINRVAIQGLPDEIRTFFEHHETYLSQHSIDPDLWRNDDPDEQYRHYIDIDMYGTYPFEDLPRSLAAANDKFGEDTVKKRGIATWWVVRIHDRLTKSMREGHADSIIAHAAALGHYVADLHMPLHTVENYDGQLSGNKGIHARFERWMIEEFSDDIEITIEKARDIEDPLTYIFSIVLRSFLLADEVLEGDTKAKRPEKAYEKEDDFDKEYYAALFSEVGELADKQMSLAASTLANFWYSAWVKAGKPKLAVK